MPTTLRIVHRNGEVKSVDVGIAGYYIQVYWPTAGWYRVFRRSGRIAGAKSWSVHPNDMDTLHEIPVPKRPRKPKENPDAGTAAPGPSPDPPAQAAESAKGVRANH